jgi:hypothetical protein
MTFESYIEKAWIDHATDSVSVAKGFAEGCALIKSNEQLASMAGLMTHVYGEHLGQWQSGIEALENLTSHTCFISNSESDQAIKRSVAALNLASASNSKEGSRVAAPESFSVSDQIRILATALAGFDKAKSKRAGQLLLQATELAKSGSSIDMKDPANRALAVTGNNLACALEERTQLSIDETELMIFAAKVGRTYWEIAGTPLHVNRAQYRLTMALLRAGVLEEADQHAQLGIELAQNSGAAPLEFFSAYEALARVERARLRRESFAAAKACAVNYFEKLSPADQEWCRKSLEELL